MKLAIIGNIGPTELLIVDRQGNPQLQEVDEHGRGRDEAGRSGQRHFERRSDEQQERRRQ
jgi:hypothetical protein